MPYSRPLLLPCGVSLPNRLAKSAMSEDLAEAGGRPGAALRELYRRWGAGGAGMLLTGHVMVDSRSRSESGNVVLEAGADLEAFTAWAATAQAQGTPTWVQLNHPGRQAPRNVCPQPVAPSAVPLTIGAGMFAPPRALEDEEIVVLIAKYATAAGLAKEAGFQGVQVHGAHGYLVAQFLSPLSNWREDRWGGSLENRMRFPLAIIGAIREAVGPAFPVGIKVNSADFQRGGFDEDDALIVVRALQDAGIDLIELSGGSYEAPVMMGAASTRSREAYFLEFARKARAATSAPLMLTGGFRSAAAMREAIESGAVDVVGLARTLALEPDLPGRLLAGTALAARDIEAPRLGIKAIDAFLGIVWHAQQLERMSQGRDPNPRQGALQTLFGAVRGMADVQQILRRG